MDRRRLIKLVIIATFGVLILVEGYTLLSLVGVHLGGETSTAGHGTDIGGATDTPVERVGPGDELLPDTDRRETVQTLAIAGSDGNRTLTMAITVENAGESGYELEVGPLTTVDGTTVSGSAATGQIESGETATLSVEWSIPAGSTPDTVAVTAFQHGSDSTQILVSREVALADTSGSG